MRSGATRSCRSDAEVSYVAAQEEASSRAYSNSRHGLVSGCWTQRPSPLDPQVLLLDALRGVNRVEVDGAEAAGSVRHRISASHVKGKSTELSPPLEAARGGDRAAEKEADLHCCERATKKHTHRRHLRAPWGLVEWDCVSAGEQGSADGAKHAKTGIADEGRLAM